MFSRRVIDCDTKHTESSRISLCSMPCVPVFVPKLFLCNREIEKPERDVGERFFKLLILFGSAIVIT